MSELRRYELLLPLRLNDGNPVPDSAIADSLVELEQQFGAVSCESQTIRGHWTHEGKLYRDDLLRLFIDVVDTPENREFFRQFKERLKTRFQQIDIYLSTYLVEVL